MPQGETDLERAILALAKKTGALRARDLDAVGLPRAYLGRLVKAGKLERVARGLYILPDVPMTEHHTLAEVAKLIPKGVVSLLSALAFHGIGTQAPYQVWLTIGADDRRPAISTTQLRVIRASGEALTSGIETHAIEGVPVRVYSAAKTVADCFKYRSRVGLDVALEALREYLGGNWGTVDELTHYAAICRVSNVMLPYMQAMVS